MPSRLTLIGHVTFGMPHRLALIALAGCAAAWVAYDAAIGCTQAVQDQIAREESAFCLKLGMSPGPQFASCLQDVARLVRREDELRSVDF